MTGAIRLLFSLCSCLLVAGPVQAQTSFAATWSFDGENKTGMSSNVLVGVSDMATSNVTVSTINTIAYVTGQSGKAINIQNWATSGCNNTEYVTFTITPTSGTKLTVTQFSLYFNQSTAGPTLVKIRSSADNYASDLYSQVPTSSFQQASLTINNLVDQTGPVSFRIFACSAQATGGALRLDEVTINGSVTAAPLPVTLLSFTAKPGGDRVQLAWSTTSEYNADRFVVERSPDLNEYTTVGEVAAKGTTDQQQYYGLTDLTPQPGINYYRLQQVDVNGTQQRFKPIAVLVQTDGPVIAVYPNPADAARIHVRLWQADEALVRLFRVTGQPVAGRLERQAGEADFVVDELLSAGVYWLAVEANNQQRIIRIVVR